MKQPRIKIEDKLYKVIELGFSSRTGELDRVLFEVEPYKTMLVLKNDKMIIPSLDKSVKITEPTIHPYKNFYHAPDLESILVFEK